MAQNEVVILSIVLHSNSIYIIKCSHRIVVSTQDFHSCNTSSILVGSTNTLPCGVYIPIKIKYDLLLYGRDDVGEVLWSHSSVGRAIHF